MKIVLDIGYDIRGRKPGRQLNMPYRFKESVLLDIEEIHPDDAPVAVKWRARKKIECRLKAYDEVLTHGDENGEMLTRWHDGRHWLCLAGSQRDDIGAPWLIRQLEMTKHEPRDAPAINNPINLFESVKESGRGPALEAVAEARDRLISVDGVLHLACAQPAVRTILTHKTRGYGNYEENMAIDTRSRYLDGNSGYMMGVIAHPLADWDRVRSRVHAQALDTSAVWTESHLTRPEVYIPESISKDVDARRAVDSLVKKALYIMSAPKEAGVLAKEFFEAKTNQRHDLLEALVGQAEKFGKPLHPAHRQELLRSVANIEDDMSIEIGLVAEPSRLGM
ncbi:hypothetical protein [Rhizobium sp. BK176]|uniref:hypothetical protein n=1 Tax=Rhizobium sp. BK176 TaxID=2587071 RepID=UPI0021688860|nr:hypothetical protein [Rhizobium sp. BK176]MCS4089191.1 hypothetical protein [Rhizobium sp. BK176]